MENIFLAFLLTLIAGLSTLLGSFITFVFKKENKSFLSLSLGFSAGVMIYISMIEMLNSSKELLTSSLEGKTGDYVSIIAFFSGMLLILLINRCIPEDLEQKKSKEGKNSLMRTGTVTALVIGIHNFPEGLATFISALKEPMVALPLVIAIAIHNIPEGIAVSAPIYRASGSKKKAFLFCMLSGIAEPLGALIGYAILMPFVNDLVFGIVYALVAGIMVFISFDELLPSANGEEKSSTSIYGLILGMLIMAVSLVLLK